MAGRFDEISDDGRSVETRVFCSAGKIMDAVTEFMEEGDDFLMLEQRWLGFRGFREIADKCCGGVPASTIGIAEAGLEREIRCMAILALTRMKIQIEIPNKRTSFALIIPNAEDLDIFMPRDILCLSSC